MVSRKVTCGNRYYFYSIPRLKQKKKQQLLHLRTTLLSCLFMRIPFIFSLTIYKIKLLSNWYKKLQMKINQSKSVQVTFTTCSSKSSCPSVLVEDVAYLGLHLNRRLTWSKHTRKQLKLNLKQMITRRNSRLTIKNIFVTYKTVFKSVWLYGFQL